MNESGVDATFFGSPDYVPVNKDIDLSATRNERGILPDAQERFYRLLENNGWQQVVELANGEKLPTLDEWIEHRITNDRGTKFFPCFITNSKGEVFFLKTQVSQNPDNLESLSNEAKILKEFNKMGYPSPRFFEFGEAGNDCLSFIRIEAIKPGQGRVAQANEWQEEHVISAIDQIKKMESADLSLLPDNLLDLEAFQKRYAVTEIMVDLVGRALEYLPNEVKDRLKQLKEEGDEVKNVLVHGDMTLKNIVISKHGGVLPVDFELAKVGFLGQDAGKLLINLMANPTVFEIGLNTYINRGDGIDQNRLRALIIGMVTENLVHLVWRVENEQINIKTRTDIYRYIKNIRDILKIEEKYKQLTPNNEPDDKNKNVNTPLVN